MMDESSLAGMQLRGGGGVLSKRGGFKKIYICVCVCVSIIVMCDFEKYVGFDSTEGKGCLGPLCLPPTFPSPVLF
jgi:hypothetical protein